MFKNISKSLLAVCIVVSAFYGVTAFAYTPVVANAGPDKYFNAPFNSSNNYVITALQGFGTDPNPGGWPLTFYWTCTGGNLSDKTIASPTFTVLYTIQKVSYTCTLKVTDSYGISDTDDVSIYLNSNVNYLNPGVQTNPATNTNNNGVTLNGSFYANDIYNTNYVVWFEWGTDVTYGNQTSHQAVVSSWSLISSWSFSQNLTGLVPNIPYHFRAVAERQNNGKMYYGQDMIFYSDGTGANVVLAGGTYGSPTIISTGFTNDLLKDSFFIPLLIVVMGFWIVVFARKRSKI